MTPPEYYVAGFSGPHLGDAKHPEGWNEVTVTRNGFVQFTVADNPGGIHGTVTGAGHEPVAGAPVYLEKTDAETGMRLGELRTVLTDVRGQYQFRGLSPGGYRVLATFEYQAPDWQTMATAQAQSVTVQGGGDVQQDLDLFVMR